MKHLSSKILAVIAACSAAVLLNVNVHAANNQNQRFQVNSDRSRTLANKTVPSSEVKPSRVVMPRNLRPHHYNYQNLRTVKDEQAAAVRLGAYRGRRAKRNQRPGHNRRTNKRGVRRQNRKGRRSVKQNRRGKRSRNQNKKAKKSNRKQSRYPQLVKPREKVVNQKRSAVNHFKKQVSYVNNQQPANFQSSGNYGDSDYGRVGTPITGTTDNNDTVTFHRLTFIPKKLGNNQFYSPQGLVVAGHYAYVITNATNSYETSHNNDTDSNKQTPASYVDGDDSTGTSPYRVGASQIIRINLNRHVKDYNENLKAARRNIKVGPVFYGGHGQGFAYNLKEDQLWLLNNTQGQVTKTAVSLINQRTLLPQLRINFHFGDTTIGDDLAFAKNGQALNVTEAGSDSFADAGAIKFFTGSVTSRGIRMNLVKQALRWAPSDVIQGLAYNRRNNRLYILGDDSITSVPVNRLGHLKSGDVWNTQFNTTREFEGLSFDNAGNGYLLTSRSPEILKSNYNQELHF